MTYRVIQWATGATGRYALRSIIQDPTLELAGLYVHSPEKNGMDAGELCGLKPVGVKATNDIEAIMEIDADVVMHMPLPSVRANDEEPDYDEKMICRLLESGKNVITTIGFLYPKAYGQEVLDRLESACAAGNVSFHGTGSNPGFLSDLLPLVCSSICARVDRIYALESSVFDFYPSPNVIFENMQFGKKPDDFKGIDGKYGSWLSGLFIESVHMLADGFGVVLDEIKSHVEIELADQSFDIAAGTLSAGTIVAQRWKWEGIVQGKPFIVIEVIYKAVSGTAPQWNEQSFKVHVEGKPNVLIDLQEGWLTNALLGTAAHAVNAIPYVCDAKPGVRTFLDLPLIIAQKTIFTSK